MSVYIYTEVVLCTGSSMYICPNSLLYIQGQVVQFSKSIMLRRSAVYHVSLVPLRPIDTHITKWRNDRSHWLIYRGRVQLIWIRGVSSERTEEEGCSLNKHYMDLLRFRYIFSMFLNVDNVGAEWMSSGRLFQSTGPATHNTLYAEL